MPTGAGTSAEPPRRGPLHERHQDAGARWAEFGGWQMPVEYAGAGVLTEHRAVRGAVGLFDVSHLGKVTVRGPDAAAYVNACLTNDLGRIRPGQAQYTLCCDERTGGVVDDLVVYLRADDDLLLVPNAANAAEVARRLAAQAPPRVEVRDEHTAYAVLAVQGPRSDDVLAGLGLPEGHDYLTFVDAGWRGVPVVVCRTGYTGEHGYELLPPWQDAGELWDAAAEQVRRLGGALCGLGARDTLRTEMGYPLHGHELTLATTPLQARCGWAVGWGKPAFWGREALLAERARGAEQTLRGLLALGRGVPRAGMQVLSAQGERLGATTSGTFSPTLGTGVALALLRSGVADGEEVDVDVRGRALRCRVVRPPFVDARPR
jgi:aminomethyltransferase